MAETSPYGEAPDAVRYLCTVCYVSTSSRPATCPRDGAPLLPLDDVEVVAMLREQLAKRSGRKRARLTGVGVVVSLVVSAAICLAFGLEFFEMSAGPRANSWLLGLSLPIFFLWMTATWRFFAAPADDAPVSTLLKRLSIERI
jgi:hypothetical protein